MARDLFSQPSSPSGKNDQVERVGAKDLFEGLPERKPLSQTQGAEQIPEGNTFTRFAEPALTIASGILAEPAAGLVGASRAPFVGAEQATRDIERVREGLTFVPRTRQGQRGLQSVARALEPVAEVVEAAESASGDPVFEQTQRGFNTLSRVFSPGRQLVERIEEKSGKQILDRGPETQLAAAAGAVGRTLPTAATEALGLGAVRRATRATRFAPEVDEIVSTVKPKTQTAQEMAPIKTNIVPPEEKTTAQLVSDLRAGRAKRVAKQVLPDETIRQSAAELGIDVNPDHYSANASFINTMQAIKDSPDTTLAAREIRAIEELGNRADSLVDALGGATDRSTLSDNIASQMRSNIDDLYNQAEVLYSSVDKGIPRATKVDLRASKQYLQRTLDDLGGDTSLLSAAEKRLARVIEKSDSEGVTYFALDRLRKDIGSGFQKRSGPFKDVDTGALKQIYRVLIEDQQGIAEAMGQGDAFQAARKLVADRKRVEDEAIKLFGRELNQSIIPKLNSATGSLSKGDASKFNSLMQQLPENRRAEVAATVLDGLFSSGARRGPGSGVRAGFVQAFESLNRNKSAKNILFKDLRKINPEAEKRFNLIGNVATGIFRSKAFENKSRTANNLKAQFADGGVMNKIYGVAKRAATFEGINLLTGLPPGAGALVALAVTRQSTPAMKRADNLISSPAFKKAMEQAAREQVQAAETTISRSQAFKSWLSSLPSREAAEIGSVGFIPFLMGNTQASEIETEQEEQQ